MMHINLSTTFYTHAEHTPNKTIYKEYYMETHTHTHTHTHTTHTHSHTHTHTHTEFANAAIPLTFAVLSRNHSGWAHCKTVC